MSILDIFKSAPAQAPAQTTNPQGQQGDPNQQGVQVPPNQGNIPAASTVNVDPNNPTAPVTPAPADATPSDPLEGFKNLWDTPPVDKDNPAPAEPQPLTAEQLQKAVANANFSNTITPETMQAIAAGGEDATQAFANAMNEVAKQTMVQATLVSNKLTEKAVADAIAKQQESIPDLVRQYAVKSHAQDTNPLLNNPAIKPVVEATQAQLQVKYPNATPAELTQMTQDYILAMGKAFAPQDSVNDNTSEGGTDWDVFMNS